MDLNPQGNPEAAPVSERLFILLNGDGGGSRHEGGHCHDDLGGSISHGKDTASPARHASGTSTSAILGSDDSRLVPRKKRSGRHRPSKPPNDWQGNPIRDLTLHQDDLSINTAPSPSAPRQARPALPGVVESASYVAILPQPGGIASPAQRHLRSKRRRKRGPAKVSKRQSRLDEAVRDKVAEVRKMGPCMQCKRMKKACDGNFPCGSCTKSLKKCFRNQLDVIVVFRNGDGKEEINLSAIGKMPSSGNGKGAITITFQHQSYMGSNQPTLQLKCAQVVPDKADGGLGEKIKGEPFACVSPKNEIEAALEKYIDAFSWYLVLYPGLKDLEIMCIAVIEAARKFAGRTMDDKTPDVAAVRGALKICKLVHFSAESLKIIGIAPTGTGTGIGTGIDAEMPLLDYQIDAHVICILRRTLRNVSVHLKTILFAAQDKRDSYWLGAFLTTFLLINCATNLTISSALVNSKDPPLSSPDKPFAHIRHLFLNMQPRWAKAADTLLKHFQYAYGKREYGAPGENQGILSLPWNGPLENIDENLHQCVVVSDLLEDIRGLIKLVPEYLKCRDYLAKAGLYHYGWLADLLRSLW